MRALKAISVLLLPLALINHILVIAEVEDESSIGVPEVEISTGLLRGYHDKSYKGKVFSAFDGVPYARPPIGELRFQPPEEPYNWTGTWMASTQHACIPFLVNVEGLEIPVSEDCLYLNVYVPREKISSTDNLDVVVHIHGGGFMLGHPHSLFGPKYLMDVDVIYISLTYRLGPLGFLSTEDDVIPGNNGLKDQTMALKWIQKNIKYFGGNPESVTLTGLSAGGASVHFHYLSPLSKGLFHRGYSASGTVLDPWVIQEAPLFKAKLLATTLGCSAANSKEILDCFMQRSARALFEATQKLYVMGMPFSPFGPVIEKTTKGAFLSRNPYTQLVDGQVQDLPWLVALTTDEGIFPAGFYNEKLEEVEENWEKFAPHLLDYNYTIPSDKKNSISKQIKEHYFGNGPITYEKLIKLCSDRHFYRGTEKAIRIQRRVTKSNIYMFMFAYRGEHSYSELFHVKEADKGVSHGDDTLYYLSSTVFNELNEKDEKVKDKMLQILTTFIKTNSPKLDDTDWKPISSGKLDYLYFDGYENLQMRQGEDFGSNAFWKSLKLKENEDSNIHIKDEL